MLERLMMNGLNGGHALSLPPWAPANQLIDTVGVGFGGWSYDYRSAPIILGREYYRANEDFKLSVVLRPQNNIHEWGMIGIGFMHPDQGYNTMLFDWADYNPFGGGALERRHYPSYSYSTNVQVQNLGNTMALTVQRVNGICSVIGPRQTATFDNANYKGKIRAVAWMFRHGQNYSNLGKVFQVDYADIPL